jgi:hypothetical protein
MYTSDIRTPCIPSRNVLLIPSATKKLFASFVNHSVHDTEAKTVVSISIGHPQLISCCIRHSNFRKSNWGAFFRQKKFIRPTSSSSSQTLNLCSIHQVCNFPTNVIQTFVYVLFVLNKIGQFTHIPLHDNIGLSADCGSFSTLCK